MNHREPVVLAVGDTEQAVAGFAVTTGWAHESAHRRGVTDRAMQWLASTPGVRAGWDVDALISLFWVTGSSRAVRISLADVLRRVTQAPSSPPYTDTTAVDSIDSGLLMARWGLRGFGLAGSPRLGLVSATDADIADVLNRIGPQTVQLFAVNAEADTGWVPDRAVEPPPDPWTAPLVTPPVLVGVSDTFAMGWQVALFDPVAEALVRRVVEAAAVRRGALWLRRRLGPRGSHGSALVPGGLTTRETETLVADILRLRDDGPTTADMDAATEAAHAARPRTVHEMVREATADALLGTPAWRQPTQQAVHMSVVAITDALLVQAPADSPAGRLAPVRAARPVSVPDGQRHRLQPLINHGPARGTTITVGPAGLSARWPDGQAGIGRDDIVAIETWPSGQIRVTSATGHQITADPAEYVGGADMARSIRSLAPNLEAAHPEPLPPSQRLTKEYLRSGGLGGWLVTAILALVPAGLALLLAVGAFVGGGTGRERLGFGLAGALLAVGAGLLTVRAVRLRRIARVVGSRI